MRHFQSNGRKASMEPASISGGEFPAHDFGMNADKKDIFLFDHRHLTMDKKI
jgi:hypothetical protein